MDSALEGLADALQNALSARAQLCGWTAKPSDALVHTTGDLTVGALLESRKDLDFEVPRFRRAIELAPAAVSILVCGLDADATDASYRSALWWTGLVRSGIAPALRSDLHLFLIGPLGSRDQNEWRGRRSRVESDERFCRKFLWLPSFSPEPAEIDLFLDRTLLAKPWDGDTAEPRSLDPLQELLQGFSSPNLTNDQAQAWINRLSVFDSGGVAGIAEDLVAIIGGKR